MPELFHVFGYSSAASQPDPEVNMDDNDHDDVSDGDDSDDIDGHPEDAEDAKNQLKNQLRALLQVSARFSAI